MLRNLFRAEGTEESLRDWRSTPSGATKCWRIEGRVNGRLRVLGEGRIG